MQELRCGTKLHGILMQGGILEVKCDSKFCGAQRGVVILHRFSATTGEFLETKRYRDTPSVKKQPRKKVG